MTSVAVPPSAGSGVAPHALTDLLQRTADGDRDAFTALYEALAPRVFGLVLRILANRAVAEETLQDVFLEVWQKAGAFDAARGGASTWVMTIAHHRAVDRVRTYQNAADRDHRVGMRDVEAVHDDVAALVEDDAEARVTRAALGTLTASQRRVIWLAYFQGLSQSQIAALTGTPLGTVKSTTRAALMRLRGVLAPSG